MQAFTCTSTYYASLISLFRFRHYTDLYGRRRGAGRGQCICLHIQHLYINTCIHQHMYICTYTYAHDIHICNQIVYLCSALGPTPSHSLLPACSQLLAWVLILAPSPTLIPSAYPRSYSSLLVRLPFLAPSPHPILLTSSFLALSS